MDWMNLDYTKHCTTPFGAYIQANHESNPHNTNVLRTHDGIYLCPDNNFQGGHEVMDLNTGCVIMCHKVTEIPVTDVVIKAAEAMAHKQGFKYLKFKNRHGVIFLMLIGLQEWIMKMKMKTNMKKMPTKMKSMKTMKIRT